MTVGTNVQSESDHVSKRVIQKADKHRRSRQSLLQDGLAREYLRRLSTNTVLLKHVL